MGTILTIVFFMVVAALNLHPTFLRTTLETGNSITVYNAAASQKSLEIMLIITAIGRRYCLSTLILPTKYSGVK
ncbi:Cytochrome oxidase subunit II [Capnocytophaga ochracea]|uniref:Cytochrome oxidase subunit II n=1 Tax=Capnocytophaga ochracea TaxID=1018 RepID=A0A2X1H8G8_CAPOC|nr:Cytochrome oxidase subunit II [Capnocytophaga ochracea]